jgi:hypothetical protein
VSRVVPPLIGIVLSALLFIPIVRAQDSEYSRVVDATTDYFVVISEPVLFTARTLLCSESGLLWCERAENGGHMVDSALWLYAADGSLLAVSDDDGISWASLISIELEPAVYRLRAGRYGPCDSSGCLHPDYPFPSGGYYDLITTLPLVIDPTPPTGSPEPIPSALPSEQPSPEPSPSIEPSPEPSPSVEPSPSPSVEPSYEPSPIPSPTPTSEPSSTVEPSPVPSTTVAPTLDPSPIPSPEPSVALSPSQSVEPLPSPSASPDNIAGDVTAAVGEAVAAVTEAISGAVESITNLGKDLSPDEKRRAAPVAVAIVISQVASAAVAAASSAASTARKANK